MRLNIWRVLKKALLASVLVSLFTQCATLGPRSLTMSQAQLQQALVKHIAQPFTVLKVFQVQASEGQVSLDPANARLQARMQLQVSSPLLAKPAHGALAFSGIPKYDAARSAVVLDQPVIEQLSLEGARGDTNQWLKKLGNALTQQWLNTWVLYPVQAETLTVGGKRYLPTAMQVEAQGVRVTLQPQP